MSNPSQEELISPQIINQENTSIKWSSYIHDEIYRLLSGGGFGLKFEPLELLSDDPDRRPIDILIIPYTLCRQSSWNFLPRITIDLAVASPFRTAKGTFGH